jgi:hypothetical protein
MRLMRIYGCPWNARTHMAVDVVGSPHRRIGLGTDPTPPPPARPGLASLSQAWMPIDTVSYP